MPRIRITLRLLHSTPSKALLVGALASASAAQSSEHHKLLPDLGSPGARFGAAVATDGVLVAVGSSGSAHLFDAATGAQTLELVPAVPAAGFGAAVAVQGPYVVVGAPLQDGAAGVAYVFDAATGAPVHELRADDPTSGAQFGAALAMDDGLLVVGALQSAWLFDVATGEQLEELVPAGGPPVGGTGIATIDGGFGQAVGIDAGRVVVGAKTANGASLYSGAAYVFDTAGQPLHVLSAGAAWSQFGGSVEISGDRVVVGAKYASPNGKDSGQAYLFDAGSGSLVTGLVPADGHIFAHFGSSVAVDGALVAIGAEQDNGAGAFDAGAVYLYAAEDGAPVDKLTASDAAPLDDLGVAVAVSAGVIVAGATGDDDNGDSSGSAYLFDQAGSVTPLSGCLGNAGSLEHTGGLALAGQTLRFGMEDAQAGALVSVLLAATAPGPSWPACGIDLGGAGALLIDLTAPPLLTLGAAWDGASSAFAVPVPPADGLVGFEVQFQGVFLASSPTEPVRLTNGSAVVFGGYL